MLKILGGWVVSVGLCLLMATSVLAADYYAAFDSAATLGPNELALLGLNNEASLGIYYSAFLGNHWFIHRTQEAEITGSFNNSTGVANANVAAGNINSQIASTTVHLGGSGSGLAASTPSIHQGYSGYFIVGNSVFGQGVFSQEIYPDNNRVVVLQQTTGFLVDARSTLGHVTISHSFQGYHGVATINQAAGNLNNQVTMAAVVNGSLSSVHGRSPLRVYSNISNNLLLLDKNTSYKAVITGGSFRNYSGMLAVSQTAGNMNNTVNYVGLTLNAGSEHGQALSNNLLGNITAISKNNNTTVVEGKKGKCPEAKIEHGAFQNFTGVASVSQVAGNFNQVVTQVGVNVH